MVTPLFAERTSVKCTRRHVAVEVVVGLVSCFGFGFSHSKYCTQMACLMLFSLLNVQDHNASIAEKRNNDPKNAPLVTPMTTSSSRDAWPVIRPVVVQTNSMIQGSFVTYQIGFVFQRARIESKRHDNSFEMQAQCPGCFKISKRNRAAGVTN